MNHIFFKVGNRPFSLYEGYNIKDKNIRFLKSIDPSIFEYMGITHYSNLHNEHKTKASLSLRLTYHLSLETLYALICALVQAPYCIYAWMLQYKVDEVRNIVEMLSTKGFKSIFSVYPPHKLNFEDISILVHQYSNDDQSKRLKNGYLFGRLWKKLASVYLDEQNIAEYNSIKHGFRSISTGFTLLAGIEKEYGISPPQDEMKVIGGGDFGNYYFSVDKLKGQENITGKPNITTIERALNWSPDSMMSTIQLVYCSINNIISYLQIHNGVIPKEVSFLSPEDEEVFTHPFKNLPSVNRFNLKYNIDEVNPTLFSKQEIEDHLVSVVGKLREAYAYYYWIFNN